MMCAEMGAKSIACEKKQTRRIRECILRTANSIANCSTCVQLPSEITDNETMRSVLSAYYRLPDQWGTSDHVNSVGQTGFFRFGSKIICYGNSESGVAPQSDNAQSFDALKSVHREGSEIHLPFDISEVIENLRREHYVKQLSPESKRIGHSRIIRNAYYFCRHLLPNPLRRALQRSYFEGWKNLPFPSWPVDFTVDELHKEYLRLCMEAKGQTKIPFIWFWPDGAPNGLILTHDVETITGRDMTSRLMDLDSSYGFRASIQVVPEERYGVPDSYVDEIRGRGFEFNVHDLNHDGNLYRNHSEFLLRAKKINEYVHKYNSQGFRSGAMYRNVDWYDAFEFSYDMSVPNVAHLEPQRGGCCTVMPYFLGRILEIPLTTSQDYSLFHILNDYSIELWKEQVDRIRAKNGLISFIAHPDYLVESRARGVYEKLLTYLTQLVKREKIWMALPRDVDNWWRARNEMKLVWNGSDWEIVGPQRERARLAYASVQDGELQYEVSGVLQEGVRL